MKIRILTQQKILIRVWLNKDGSTTPLIVTSDDAYKRLVSDAHTHPSSSIKHVGCRRTFTAISRRYFSFNGRDHVSKIIGLCAVCRLNNYGRGTPNKTGNQLSLRPNEAAALDIVGPLRGFAQTASGRPRYVICYIDLHSRLTIAKSASSAADDEVLLALKGVRHRLVGLPKRLLVDNALVNDGSASASFLHSHGVQVTHGLAYVSRCQSKVERCIGSFTRLLCKLHTQQPNADFNTLVEEAALTMNSTPSASLGGRLSPKDVHFNCPPSNFFPPLRDDGGNELMAARLRSKEVVLEEVKRNIKKAPITSPTDYTNKIKVGQLALKKRSVFPVGAPKKLAFKTLINPLKIVQKVATNSYRCINLFTNEESIVAGDLLIKVSALDERELKKLCTEMEQTIR